MSAVYVRYGVAYKSTRDSVKRSRGKERNTRQEYKAVIGHNFPGKTYFLNSNINVNYLEKEKCGDFHHMHLQLVNRSLDMGTIIGKTNHRSPRNEKR